jgi:DNA-binding response OmpR family regulator
MTILVVEDDPIVLSLVDRMLTRNGHTVLAAEDADQARFVLSELKAIDGL